MQVDAEQIIVEHALQTSSTLEVAIDVAFAFEAIRHAVIRDAITRLEGYVKAQLGDLATVDVESSFKFRPIPDHASFSLRMNDWPEQYRLHLFSDKNDAVDLYIGLKDGKSPVLTPTELIEGLAGVRIGKSDPEYGWAWWYYLEPPLRSWKSKDALLALKSDEVVRKLALDMASIAEGISGLLRARRSPQ